MDFEFNQEQLMFRDMAREFAKRELAWEKIREYEREDQYNHELHRKLGQAGFLGIVFSKEYGGLGLDFTTATVVVEELAKADFWTANTVGSATLPGIPIALAGTEEQKRKYLPPLLSGEKIMSNSATEPNAGSDQSHLETMSVLEGDEWVLNGTKTWLGRGWVSDAILVMAQTDKSKGHRGVGLFLVDTETQGFHRSRIKHMVGLRFGCAANARFVNCRIPKENLIGEIGGGVRLTLTGVDNARWSQATASVGMAEGCLDMCVEYVKTRHQFGRPIGGFQLVQGILADMATEIEAGRWLVYHLAYLKDKGLRHRKEASMAKVHTTEMAFRVTANAVHLHGAYGVTDDLPLESHYRSVPLEALVGGTTEMHRLFIGRELTGIDAIQ